MLMPLGVVHKRPNLLDVGHIRLKLLGVAHTICMYVSVWPLLMVARVVPRREVKQRKGRRVSKAGELLPTLG